MLKQVQDDFWKTPFGFRICYFLVPFRQKLNKFDSNFPEKLMEFVRLLASLRELKVCLDLFNLTSLRASPFSRSD